MHDVSPQSVDMDSIGGDKRNIIESIKGWFLRLFKTNINNAFKIDTIRSPDMEREIKLWIDIAEGKPPWLDIENDIRTICFSNTMARELASLITQNIDIKIESEYGTGENAVFLQGAIDNSFIKKAQDIIERMIRYGGVMAKWNGESIDFLDPDRFIVTDTDSNKDITGAIFFSYYTKGKRYYTKAEWHRFDGETPEKQKIYRISNKAFVSDNADDIGMETALSNTKWNDINPETEIIGLESPLFVYLKNPYSNTVDTDSPLGVSCFSECKEELRWLDVAMSSLGTETETSKPMMFVDEGAIVFAKNNGIKLPKFVKGLQMLKVDSVVSQWQPTLQVQNRIDGINFYLSILSYKAGFDPGYFVFNGQSISIATATQVEATERRTFNTVMSYRNLIGQPAINGDGRTGFAFDIVRIIDTMAVMAGQISAGNYGNYRVYVSADDITANKEENKAFDYQLANAGYMAKWRFLVRNLGMTEDEAKEMVLQAQQEQKEAQKNQGGLFDEE